MKFNPQIHQRHSIRLKNYDYSQAGLYFITICCKNHRHYYGQIIQGELYHNAAGTMIEKWYFELENKFPDIRCHEMVVMPNHFHCIIENVVVGATLRGRPIHKPTNQSKNLDPKSLDSSNVLKQDSKGNVLKQDLNGNVSNNQIDDLSFGDLGDHTGSPLHRVVGWFKTMSTNEYIRGVKNLGWKRFDGKLWQRNYWEHIIRDDRARERIAQYIIDNPKKWKWDTFYD